MALIIYGRPLLIMGTAPLCLMVLHMHTQLAVQKLTPKSYTCMKYLSKLAALHCVCKLHTAELHHVTAVASIPGPSAAAFQEAQLLTALLHASS